MTDTVAAASEWLDVEQVAERLHVPVGTVRKWRANGDGAEARKFGRHLRYHVSAVDAWAHAQVPTRKEVTA